MVPVSNQPQVISRALGTKGSSRVFPAQPVRYIPRGAGACPPVWGVILLRLLASFVTTLPSLFTTPIEGVNRRHNEPAPKFAAHGPDRARALHRSHRASDEVKTENGGETDSNGRNISGRTAAHGGNLAGG